MRQERQGILLVVLGALVSALHHALEANNLMPTIGKVPTVGDRKGIGIPTDARPTYPPS